MHIYKQLCLPHVINLNCDVHVKYMFLKIFGEMASTSVISVHHHYNYQNHSCQWLATVFLIYNLIWSLDLEHVGGVIDTTLCDSLSATTSMLVVNLIQLYMIAGQWHAAWRWCTGYNFMWLSATSSMSVVYLIQLYVIACQWHAACLWWTWLCFHTPIQRMREQ